MAAAIALVPYFFWSDLICVVGVSIVVGAVIRRDFHNLSVGDICAAQDTQNREYGDEDSFGLQPLIQLKTDKETKPDTTGHGQPQLHDDGEVLGPGAVFFVIKELSQKNTPEISSILNERCHEIIGFIKPVINAVF
jgi:hypothetical protein